MSWWTSLSRREVPRLPNGSTQSFALHLYVRTCQLILLSRVFVNFIQTLEEALKENGDNPHPYVVCTGDINSAVVICNKKVITSEIGSVVFSSLITLRWWYTPAIMIFMTFFLVKYLAKGAGTEAK